MARLRDFLHPLWRDSMYKESPKAELNKAILDSLDTELTETEEETINAKAQSFLGSATDEWLDYWGSWFGLKRDKGQSDEDYRKAIKNHVTHARDTIPALQESIAKFLETNVSNVNIYEPWQDIFLLNDTSHLNGSAHLTSGYYHYAIIDIHISVSFPPEIKEIINWFRPAGVLWMLTYTPGESPNAEIWTMPPFDAHSVARLTELKIMTGFTNDKRGLLSPASMDTGYGLLPFILNDSLLNTKEVLSGLANMGTGFYNYVGTLHGLVEPSNSDTVETLADQVNVINPDEYSKLTDADRDTIDIPVSKFADTANLLDYTYSFDYWNSADSSVYRDTEKYQGKSVMVMTKSRVGISRSQDLNLVKGKEYRVSVYAKTSNNSVGTGVAFNIDSAHSEVHLSDKLTSSWQLYTKTFVYLDGNMKDVAIYPVGNMDGTEVYIAGFMLQEVSNNMLDYSKSLKDINVPVEDNLQYTYVFMDFRKFFYQTMQSEPAVRSSVGFYYTGKEINTYMSKFVDARSLVIDYFAKNLKQSAHSQLMIYNFNLGMWVNYMDENLVVNDVNYSLDFASVEPILNNNGVMAFAIASDIKDEAYTLALDDIHFGVHKLVEYDQGIRMYAEGANSDPIMSPSNTYFTPIIEVNNHQDLIDRYQEHYPIRYIKNIVRSAKIVDPTNLPSSFILNQSNLNGQDFLHVLTGTSSASEDYTLYQYQANVNDTDKAKPRMSISMLGADVQDSVHKDVMANLLDGTMFESRMLPEMTFASQIKNETTLVQVLTDKGPGYEITDPNTTETIVQFTSQATYPETDYIFSLDILQGSSTDTTYNTKPSVSVVVTAESNDWKTAFSDTYTFENASHIEIPVDTEEFFANHFKFTVTLVNNTGLAYMNAIIANPEFKLLMSSTFDGQVIELPGLEVAKLPLIFRTPIRYGDLNTGKDTWKDIRGIISYKDTTWVDDGKEHELVTDLGRVHTDISRLYLQHGADSVENAQYDSVVQTSVDGKHWHTWYDNFQGKRGYVDPYYSEVVNQPRYLSLPVYNTLQDRVDQGKPGYLVNRKVWEEDGQVFDVTNAYTNDFQASSVAERYPIMSLSKLLLGTYASGRTEFKSGNLIDDKYKATKTGWDYNNGGLFVVRSIIYSDTILPLATYKNLVDSGGAGTTQHSRTIEESLDPTGATVTSTTSTTTRKVVNPVDKNQFEVNETDSPLNGQTLLSSNLADFNPHISYPDNPDGTPGFIPVQEKSEIQEQVISYSVLEFLVAQPGVMSLYNLLIAQYPSDLGTAVNTLLRYLMSTHVPVHMELKADVTDATLVTVSFCNSGSSAQQWTNVVTNTKGVKGTTSIGFDIDINNLIESPKLLGGLINVLVTSQNHEGTATQSLKLTGVEFTIAMDTSQLEDFHGGTYPHHNYIGTDLGVVEALGASEPEQIIQTIPLDPTALNKKVRVSFNLRANIKSGTVYLDSNIKGLTATAPSMVEYDNQHFSYLINVPDSMIGNPELYLRLADSYAYVTVSGIKVELGASESPLVPRYVGTKLPDNVHTELPEGNDDWDTFDFDSGFAQDTSFDIEGEKKVILTNVGSTTVIPEIKADSDMTIEVGKGITTKIMAGTRKYNIRLAPGATNLTIAGNGHIDFTFYRNDTGTVEEGYLTIDNSVSTTPPEPTDI